MSKSIQIMLSNTVINSHSSWMTYRTLRNSLCCRNMSVSKSGSGSNPVKKPADLSNILWKLAHVSSCCAANDCTNSHPKHPTPSRTRNLGPKGRLNTTAPTPWRPSRPSRRPLVGPKHPPRRQGSERREGRQRYLKFKWDDFFILSSLFRKQIRYSDNYVWYICFLFMIFYDIYMLLSEWHVNGNRCNTNTYIHMKRYMCGFRYLISNSINSRNTWRSRRNQLAGKLLQEDIEKLFMEVKAPKKTGWTWMIGSRMLKLYLLLSRFSSAPPSFRWHLGLERSLLHLWIKTSQPMGNWPMN